MTMARMRGAMLAVAMAGVTLAGCSRSAPEAEPVRDAGLENASAVEVPIAPDPLPAPVAPIANEVAPAPPPIEVPPEAAPTADEQVSDDAAAAGMTARAIRDEAAASANEVADTERQ